LENQLDNLRRFLERTDPETAKKQENKACRTPPSHLPRRS
jgi:hypothetical protein